MDTELVYNKKWYSTDFSDLPRLKYSLYVEGKWISGNVHFLAYNRYLPAKLWTAKVTLVVVVLKGFIDKLHRERQVSAAL